MPPASLPEAGLNRDYIMGYNATMLTDIRMGMIVRLRKPHPCGGYEWTVVRLGADIGLECTSCKHRVMLTRREFIHRTKKIIFLPDVHSESATKS